jgi:hypothetical protein
MQAVNEHVARETGTYFVDLIRAHRFSASMKTLPRPNDCLGHLEITVEQWIFACTLSAD